MSNNLCQRHIYSNCKFKIIKQYANKYHPLLLSIKKEEWIDICYYLNKIFKNTSNESSYEIYRTIFGYLLNDDLSLYKIFDDLWKARTDKRDFHFTLKMICKLKLKTNSISLKNVFVLPLKEDIEEIKSLEESVNPIYKTLLHRRWFKIDEHIGSFDLYRFKMPNYKNENYNWEYYASFTPLWKERMENFNASINHENKTIEFDDDDSLEGFYEKYGYELDEQSREVQDCSMLEIIKKSWIEWFNYVGFGFLGCRDANEKVFQISNDMIKTYTGIDISLDDIPDDFRFK
jgi:hypothetical protein